MSAIFYTISCTNMPHSKKCFFPTVTACLDFYRNVLISHPLKLIVKEARCGNVKNTIQKYINMYNMVKLVIKCCPGLRQHAFIFGGLCLRGN